MRANEFRIGNYVYSEMVEDVIQLSALLESQDLQVKPIPLTEELLLKCGFRNYSANIFVLDKKYYYNKSTKTIFVGQEPIFEIEYLHTLQNFFALTNQELKIIL